MPAELELYDRYRPRYPLAAVDQIAIWSRLRRGAVVADVGCGSGIFAEQLLRCGYRVVGIEPLASMRTLATERLRAFPSFVQHAGRAEDTGLPPRSVALVTAASALHWFDPAVARPEFERVTSPPGGVAALWNFRVATAGPFAREFDRLWREHLGPPPAGGREHLEEAVVPSFFRGAALHRWVYPNHITCSEARLLGLLRSSSNAPEADGSALHRLRKDVRTLHRRFARCGRVVIPFETVLVCGLAEASDAHSDRSVPAT